MQEDCSIFSLGNEGCFQWTLLFLLDKIDGKNELSLHIQFLRLNHMNHFIDMLITYDQLSFTIYEDGVIVEFNDIFKFLLRQNLRQNF